MAPAYGISPTGFYAKPLSVVDQEIDDGLRGILGDSAGTDSDGKIPLASMAGQLKSLLVDGFSAHWDLMEAAVGSLDPAKAAGAFLDTVCAITGTQRQAARNSVATGLCVGDPNTSLPVGRAATVDGTTARFSTATGFIIATGTAYTSSGAYLRGDLRYIPGQNRHYLCVATGIGNASGPSGTAELISVGAAYFRYLGEGIGLVKAPFIADVIGAIGVATGSLSEIATPVSGWNSVYNALAGIAGARSETDASLRGRREQELATAGNTTVDAIRANILRVNAGSVDPNHEPPTAVKVFFNDTDVTDSNGVPPHSIEILVQDGTTADIAQAIWDSTGAGTRTYGGRTDQVLDSEGQTQLVNWTRPTEVQIWVYATGRYDATQWPASSETAVAQAMLSALLTYTADYPIARDVRTSPLLGAFMRGPAGTTGGLAVVPADPDAASVLGLLEVDPISISTATGTTGTAQIAITARQIAVFDSSRCVIDASSEDP